MQTDQTILEHWFARVLDDYPTQSVSLLSPDPFRNPVGHTLRHNLAIVLQQLLGDMDIPTVRTALENIVRIRAVQDLSVDQAVGFVFSFKPVLQQFQPQADVVSRNARIDQLGLIARAEYTRCRERIAEIRTKERRSAMGGAIALVQTRRAR